MIYNSQLRKIIGKYPMQLILEFIAGLPLPDTTDFRFYAITSDEGLPVQIWGHNPSEILEQFEDFTDLLIIT